MNSTTSCKMWKNNKSTCSYSFMYRICYKDHSSGCNDFYNQCCIIILGKPGSLTLRDRVCVDIWYDTLYIIVLIFSAVFFHYVWIAGTHALPQNRARSSACRHGAMQLLARRPSPSRTQAAWNGTSETGLATRPRQTCDPLPPAASNHDSLNCWHWGFGGLVVILSGLYRKTY